MPTVIWASTYLSIAASIASAIARAKQILGAGSSSPASGISMPSSGGSIAGTGQQNEQAVTYPVGGGGSQGGQAIGKVVVVEHDITQAQQNVNYINKISVI